LRSALGGPSGFGSPPPHAHPEAETFYLLAGDLEFTGITRDSAYTFRSGPGATVHIPGSAPFQFVNVGLRPARVLTITMPGGLERDRAEFAALLPAGVPPDAALADPHVREKVAALDARYGHWYVRPGAPTTTTLGTDKSLVHVPAGEGTALAIGQGTNTVKLTSADTNGEMTLVEGVFPTGIAAVPLHTPPAAETVYLFDGEVEFTGVTDGRPYTFAVHADDVVHVPPHTPHQFTIVGGEPARGLVIVTPGGFERYLAEMATVDAARRLTGRRVAARDRVALCVQYVQLGSQEGRHAQLRER
jgi:quercetin dioxygenase-like cupin family protein